MKIDDDDDDDAPVGNARARSPPLRVVRGCAAPRPPDTASARPRPPSLQSRPCTSTARPSTPSPIPTPIPTPTPSPNPNPNPILHRTNAYSASGAATYPMDCRAPPRSRGWRWPRGARCRQRPSTSRGRARRTSCAGPLPPPSSSKEERSRAWACTWTPRRRATSSRRVSFLAGRGTIGAVECGRTRGGWGLGLGH